MDASKLSNSLTNFYLQDDPDQDFPFNYQFQLIRKSLMNMRNKKQHNVNHQHHHHNNQQTRNSNNQINNNNNYHHGNYNFANSQGHQNFPGNSVNNNGNGNNNHNYMAARNQQSKFMHNNINGNILLNNNNHNNNINQNNGANFLNNSNISYNGNNTISNNNSNNLPFNPPLAMSVFQTASSQPPQHPPMYNPSFEAANNGPTISTGNVNCTTVPPASYFRSASATNTPVSTPTTATTTNFNSSSASSSILLAPRPTNSLFSAPPLSLAANSTGGFGLNHSGNGNLGGLGGENSIFNANVSETPNDFTATTTNTNGNGNNANMVSANPVALGSVTSTSSSPIRSASAQLKNFDAFFVQRPNSTVSNFVDVQANTPPPGAANSLPGRNNDAAGKSSFTTSSAIDFNNTQNYSNTQSVDLLSSALPSSVLPGSASNPSISFNPGSSITGAGFNSDNKNSGSSKFSNSVIPNSLLLDNPASLNSIFNNNQGISASTPNLLANNNPASTNGTNFDVALDSGLFGGSGTVTGGLSSSATAGNSIWGNPKKVTNLASSDFLAGQTNLTAGVNDASNNISSSLGSSSGKSFLLQNTSSALFSSHTGNSLSSNVSNSVPMTSAATGGSIPGIALPSFMNSNTGTLNLADGSTPSTSITPGGNNGRSNIAPGFSSILSSGAGVNSSSAPFASDGSSNNHLYNGNNGDNVGASRAGSLLGGRINLMSNESNNMSMSSYF